MYSNDLRRNLTLTIFTLTLGTTALTGCSTESPIAPTPSAPEPVASSFEEGTDGWSGSGDFENIRTASTSGVQGAYLFGGDRATGDTWYFLAPSKFRGDRSAFYGGTLSYYMKASLSTGETETASDYFGAPDVILSGADMTLHYRMHLRSYPDKDSFKEYVISLNAAPAWKVASTGEEATEAEMRAVLADLRAMHIRGEYFIGDDYAMLDEVKLSAGW